MTFEHVNEVVEAWGAEDANKLLAEGWRLLAVVQGTVPEASSHIKYVLGRSSETELTMKDFTLGQHVTG
ncbi:hypothetical protein YA0721_01730 [Pseudomonas carnis]|jgi:hypothetical protein|uniref:hypothetical protein n=1 Tax=Pseudomonas carnis TaxID=2487355 RepID=UPI0018E5AAE1|nr:hypothetical protein [Pseudomonas carnis]MBI6654607.1 hypothetical protein [Pseudomonas carnis]MBI6659764.1 hypothetical protein [Pseudomonas carnis]MBI6688360.1 hypothetical protein [Pseudomonas carnis]